LSYLGIDTVAPASPADRQ